MNDTAGVEAKRARNDRNNRYFVWLVLIALLGLIIILYSTRGGIGIISDSINDINVGKNLANGRGFGHYFPSGRFVFETRFAPLYSLTIAFIAFLKLDVFESFRWLNAILFSGFIFICGLLMEKITKSSILAVSFALVITFSPLFIYLFVYAFAEPLFYFFGILGFYFLILYLDHHKDYLLYIASIAIGLSNLVRYNALPLIIIGLFGIVIFTKEPILKRIIHSLIFGIISSIGTLVWYFIVWINTGTLAGREIVTNGHSNSYEMEVIKWIKMSFVSWIPDNQLISNFISRGLFKDIIQVSILLVIILMCGILFLRYKWKLIHQTGIREIILATMFIVLYTVLLYISYVYLAPFNKGPRNFSQNYFIIYLLLGLFGFWLFKIIKPIKLLNTVCLVLAGLLLCLNTYKGITQIVSYAPGGFSYNNEQARNSVLVKIVADMPKDITLVSNEALLLYLFTERYPYSIEEIRNGQALEDYPRFGDNDQDPGQMDFKSGKAVLVLFNTGYDQFYQIYGKHTPDRWKKFTEGLNVIYSDDEGTIYSYDDISLSQ